jgi:hypothetical protein
MKRIVLIAVLFCVTIIVTAQSGEYFKPENIKMIMRKTAKWQLKNPEHVSNDWTNRVV